MDHRDPALRARVLDTVKTGEARVVTDALASPTGFPFKVLRLEGTLSESAVYEARPRRCDLGYLRELYRRTDGTVGYRCPGEPRCCRGGMLKSAGCNGSPSRGA